MKNILLILKGILIGIGKIIPGVSGSIMAISLRIYDKAIDCITNFFDDVKNNLKYLLYLGIGVLLGIVLFSKIIIYILNKYYIYTMMLFIGLIMGGIKTIYKVSNKSISGFFLFILGLIFMGIFTFIGSNNEYIIKNNYTDNLIYFLSGMLEGFGTIIPGISSTALLMIIGTYKIFISNISNLINITYIINNINFYLSFTIGLFISIFTSIYIINYLFKKYKSNTFSFILGIITSNVLFLLLNTLEIIALKNLIIEIILLGTGYFISLYFDA